MQRATGIARTTPTLVPLVTGTLQRKSAWPQRSLFPRPVQTNSGLQMGHESLNAATHSFTDSPFRYDFSRVRVHTTQPILQRQPAQRPAQISRPEDFGISLAVVDHGATGVVGIARQRLDEIYRSMSTTNLAELQRSGITRVEMHIIPYDQKIVDLPEFARLRGRRTDDGRLWDDVRGEGGIQSGSIIRYAVGEENLTGGRHGHGAAIGLGISGGVVLGAGGAGAGFAIGQQIQGGSSGPGSIAGGIVGGILGAGLGALGGALLGGLIDEDSGYARNFTASHEGTHTVELFALTAAQRTRLQRLYEGRKAAGGPWLEPTDYTSSNVHEYWAQCASAFFSRPYQESYAASYNPEWLRRNDPGMYTLLTEVFGGGRRSDTLDMRYRERAAA